MSDSEDLKKALVNDPGVSRIAGIPLLANGARPILKLSHRHRFVAHLAALGLSQKEICERTHYTPAWISVVINQQIVVDEIDTVRKKLFADSPEQALKLNAGKAVEVISSVLHDPQGKKSLQVDTAFRALDRIYGKPTQKVEQIGGGLKELWQQLDALQQQVDSQPTEVPAIEVSPDDSDNVAIDAEIVEDKEKDSASDGKKESNSEMEQFLDKSLS